MGFCVLFNHILLPTVRGLYVGNVYLNLWLKKGKESITFHELYLILKIIRNLKRDINKLYSYTCIYIFKSNLEILLFQLRTNFAF